MNAREYHQLQAEVSTLQSMIERLPSHHVIERISLESRKREVEGELSSMPAPGRTPARVRLMFRGKPVAVSHGVRADFGAAAVKAFSHVVATVGASQRTLLRSRGVVPNREDYDLLITDTALGSFGFELEEHHTDELLPSQSPVEAAIDQTKSILEATVGTDEVLANAISGTDPRALSAVRTFLKLMADQEAVCAIEFKDDVFRFLDVGQIRQSESRLREENIHEEERTISGTFAGVLPVARTFEFRDGDTGEVISGRVGPSIGDASAINEHINRPLMIRVHSTRIEASKPRFVLVEYDPPRREESPSLIHSAD